MSITIYIMYKSKIQEQQLNLDGAHAINLDEHSQQVRETHAIVL